MTQKESDQLDLSKDVKEGNATAEAYEGSEMNHAEHDCANPIAKVPDKKMNRACLAHVFYQSKYGKDLEAINNPYQVKTDLETGETDRISPPTVIIEDNRIIFPFSHQYISTQLTKDRWEEVLLDPGNPIFIDSQTGAGKSTALLNEVASIVDGWRRKLLILVSRSALKQQIKYEAAKKWSPELLEDLTESGISKEHHFGAVDIYSYQDFINPACRKDIRTALSNWNYGAVAFDECHYFVSDADFNHYTEMQFDFLVESFIRAGVPRIYLTATPEYVFDCIYEKEMQESDYLNHLPLARFSPPRQKFLKHYYYERDYSYLQIRFFKNEEEVLLKMLVDLVQKKNKILFFSETKGYAENLIKELKQLGIRSTYLLDADSKERENKKDKSKNHEKEKEESENPEETEINFEMVQKALLQDNDTGVDILFATKCLDAGVTIKTENLSIFCLFKDRVDFIQAIGRKRLKSSKENVYLYIPTYTLDDVKKRKRNLQGKKVEMQNEIDKYREGDPTNGYESLKIPVYAENGCYKYNGFSMKKINTQLMDIRMLYEEIEEGTADPEIIIAKHILSWMGLEDTFSTDMMLDYQPAEDISTERDKILNTIIHEYEGKAITREDFEKIIDDLSSYDDREDTRTEREDLKVRSINKIFKTHNLSYKISTIPIAKKGDSEHRYYEINPIKKEVTDNV